MARRSVGVLRCDIPCVGPRVAQAELAAAREAAELAKHIVIEGLTEEKERMQEMLDVASARELQLQTQVRRAMRKCVFFGDMTEVGKH